MTTIDYSPLFRNSIGFDRFFNLLDSAMNTDHSKAGYPPYNIEVIEENNYAITSGDMSQDGLAPGGNKAVRKEDKAA